MSQREENDGNPRVQVAGAALLGCSVFTASAMTDLAQAGLPVQEVQRLALALGLSEETMTEILNISMPTFRQRQVTGRLTSSESACLVRLADVIEQAHRTMGVREGNRWLLGHWPALDFRTPLECARTGPGAESVLELMNAILEGMFP